MTRHVKVLCISNIIVAVIVLVALGVDIFENIKTQQQYQRLEKVIEKS